ncbi:nicotinate-nucleotide adenylyltransferase [Rheinheimera sp. WS51]|uniref:nicotinate-nucleotide adenylyltransferase n=1 Tax=Rheinheimera sp. WS51 TaxID=3425886 RepID=UPI003D8F2074
MTKQINLLGGTFDPIHLGHISIARAVAKECQLQQVDLMPCHLPPHRQSPGVSAEHRLNMVKLATAPYPELGVQSMELHRSSLSYTAETVRLLHQQYPSAHINLIIGMDSLSRFCSWHQWQTILEQANLIVCRRPGYSVEQGDAPKLISQYTCDSLEKLQQQRYGQIWLSRNAMVPISATELRLALQQKQIVQQWITPDVLAYIQQHNLYQQVN